jgi:hypothetical protein
MRALYGIKDKCTRHVKKHWFYTSPEENFRLIISQPSQLEQWLAIDETRILSHVAHQRNNSTMDKELSRIASLLELIPRSLVRQAGPLEMSSVLVVDATS